MRARLTALLCSGAAVPAAPVPAPVPAVRCDPERADEAREAVESMDKPWLRFAPPEGAERPEREEAVRLVLPGAAEALARGA